MSERIPQGYEQFRSGRSAVVVRARSAGTIRELLKQNTTLYDVAAAMPGARPLAGRAMAYVIRPEAESWLVRHYHRGGAVARFLDDRYLAFEDRALHELRVSERARSLGIPTPEVIAAVTYRAGVFSRFDLAVAYIANARDLADMVFDTNADTAVAKAAALIRTMLGKGLVHADLNLKNVLIAADRAYIIDLDRCTIVPRMTPSKADRMRRRFVRSLEKWQRITGRRVRADLRAELEDAFRG